MEINTTNGRFDLTEYLYLKFCKIRTILLFRHFGIKNRKFGVCGCPIIEIRGSGTFSFGDGLIMINNQKYSTLGRANKCKLLVYSGAKLTLGSKVGMSNTTIVATKQISIGNKVMIGGGVTIVDSDFHSMNSDFWFTKEDEIQMKSLPVIIGNNVFIGMDSIILKGVTIGNNVRIAAGSVIIKNIPDNQIWGGNPATFLKEII